MTAPAARPPALAGGLPVGRIGGIRIVLSWTWLISVAVVVVLAAPVVRQAVPATSTTQSILVAALLGVLLGASVLVHELGHCLAARSMGVPVHQVRLYLLGGVSELGRAPATPREEAVIAAAGPGVSALLAGTFFLLVGSTDKHTVSWLLLIELALANAIVAVFNMLPALPLDGGRVLRAGVWAASGRRRFGTVAAACGGYLVAVALTVWAAVQLTDSSRAGILQAGIAIAMAAFVALGASEEQRSERKVAWASNLSLAALARPVVQLPLEVPVGLALQAAGGRSVLLTGQDGMVAGILDEPAALALGRTSPATPAVAVATPVPPEAIVLADDDPSELAHRALSSRVAHFLLVDEQGRPAGVVPAAALTQALAGSGRRAG